jgi:hypothetical protein
MGGTGFALSVIPNAIPGQPVPAPELYEFLGVYAEY